MIFQESETVELKSIVVDDIKKEIIAFANCEGGKLYIGVQDDGTIIGVEDPDGTALQISNMVRDAIKPDLTMFLHYETLNENGKQIVAVDIQQGTERPYYVAKKGLRPDCLLYTSGHTLTTKYGHCSQILVSAGQEVKAGDAVSYTHLDVYKRQSPDSTPAFSTPSTIRLRMWQIK